MIIQNFQQLDLRSLDGKDPYEIIRKLEDKLEEKEQIIKILEASLTLSEAKFKGMDEAVKVLGDVIVNMSHGNQPAGRTQTTHQPEMNSVFGVTLARNTRSSGLVGAGHQLAPGRTYRKFQKKK